MRMRLIYTGQREAKLSAAGNPHAEVERGGSTPTGRNRFYPLLAGRRGRGGCSGCGRWHDKAGEAGGEAPVREASRIEEHGPPTCTRDALGPAEAHLDELAGHQHLARLGQHRHAEAHLQPGGQR